MLDYSEYIPKKFASYLRYFTPQSLMVGKKKVDVLYYKQQPDVSNSNKSILITAGFDGDELDGIFAALSLPPKVKQKFPNFNITILPICNPFGFVNKTSQIPFDGSFPKHYFPGSLKGNYAQKLVFALTNRFFTTNSIWIDLHGGSSFETLTPFVSGYTTHDASLNKQSENILGNLRESYTFFQTYHNWEKIDSLAKTKSIYLLSEAGDHAISRDEYITLHQTRIIKILNALTPKSSTTMSLSAMERYFLPHFSFWRPIVSVGAVLTKNQIVGFWYLLVPLLKWPVRCKNGGLVLWIRDSSRIRVSEPVCEISYRV